MILLDTHVLVYFMQDDARLGRRAAAMIAEMDQPGSVLVSPISAWEIAMLREKGRILLDRPTADWLRHVLADPVIRVASIDLPTAVEAGHLPPDIHGDPADRILIATARRLDCPFVTRDRKILEHAAAGHLQVVDARH